MRWLSTILVGIVIGAGLMYTSFNYHLVHAKEGYLFVPKSSAELTDAYVDIREWNASEWQQHTQLSQAVVKHGRSDLVVQPAAKQLWDGVIDAIDNAVLNRRGTETK